MTKIVFSYGIGIERDIVLTVLVDNPVIPRVGENVVIEPLRGPNINGIVKTVSYVYEVIRKNNVALSIYVWIVP